MYAYLIRSPHTLPHLVKEAHIRLPLSFPFFRFIALPLKALLINFRLPSPDIRINGPNILRLMPHFPANEENDEVPDSKVRCDEAFSVPRCKGVEAEGHDDADSNNDAPVAGVRRQRRFVRKEAEIELLSGNGVVPVCYDHIRGSLVDDKAGTCEPHEPVKDFHGII